MTQLLRIGVMMTAGGLMLSLAACSRTSDGTIVAETPVALPSLHLAPKQQFVPFWARRKAEPELAVEPNFPPAPGTRTAAPRRKTRPPVVVSSGSGNLACKNVGEGGRVRMVCE